MLDFAVLVKDSINQTLTLNALEKIVIKSAILTKP